MEVFGIRVCGIFDVNAEYTARLIKAISAYEAFPFEVVAFTNKASVESYTQSRKIDVMLAGEASLCDDFDKYDIDRIIPLTEENTKEPGTIYRYQSVRKIIEDIINITGTETSYDDKSKTLVTGIYSPTGDYMNTAIALNIAYEYASAGEVLFLNLEEFSGLEKIFSIEDTRDLSDLIYYYVEQNETFLKILSDSCTIYNGVHIVKPCICKEDLQYTQAEVFCGMLRMIAQSGLFRSVVVVIGNAVRNQWKLFDGCDTVYVSAAEDEIQKARLEEYEMFIQKKNLCCPHTKRITLPEKIYAQRGKVAYFRGEDSEFRNAVRQLL